MKTSARWNRLSGSTRRRIEKLVVEIARDAEARRRCPPRAWPLPRGTAGEGAE